MTTLLPLTDQQKMQAIKDAKFRLDSMLSWDLFDFIKNKYKNEKSVYSTGHVADPVLEISSVFGRQLLQFLKIKKPRKTDTLKEYFGVEPDDVTIDLLYPNMTSFPLYDQLTIQNTVHLVRLIKVANKATAHFTLQQTTAEEFESMKIARKVIYELILKYIPDINRDEVRWTRRDDFMDALQCNKCCD
jgi:23S rRNA U2552 (ribose-2'-O)-methylase RlmE/FtsJ